ncbi:MAG: DegT/DnrJ/EryC1/StrS family aminotransferase [Gemmatimonadales bacterium]
MTPTFEIPLSTPHLDGEERRFVDEAFASNWIAPLGPQVEAFEGEFAEMLGVRSALATSSGTGALHLALQLVGVGPGDDVLVSTLTFIASVNPIIYLGGRPVLIDSERVSWNLDPALVAEELDRRARAGRLPKAVVAVHLYGQTADLDALHAICARYEVPLIEDAAEALGADYRGRAPGTVGRMGVFSFNGNKIITTSGGGMLVSDDPSLIARARKLATQAREPTAHYEHEEVGYNYRLSNLLAAVGRGQLRVLPSRVEARRRHFARYLELLGEVPGIEFMPEAPWGLHTRWLTTLTIDAGRFGADREAVRAALAAASIEARPLWKPMHQQPVLRDAEVVGGAVADQLFIDGLCLPSGSNLPQVAIDRVAEVIRSVRRTGEGGGT